MLQNLAAVSCLWLTQAKVHCPPKDFDSVDSFDLDTFISKRWFVQQQMEGGLEPSNLFQCQYAEYVKLDKPNFHGFEIQAHDHIDMMDGSNKDLHPCAKIVDAQRGKLSVGECWLPRAASGPLWVYMYNETAGYAAVGGGAPKHSFPGGCRTGTGKIGGGLWIFTRERKRDDTLVNRARSELQSKGFDLDALQDVDQSGCPTEEGPYPHHPRPDWEQKASYARWLVHESDYATIVTHHNGAELFGNIISTTDGKGFTDGNASGIVYTILPSLDATYQDLVHDSRVSVQFSEKALRGSSCQGPADDGTCGRVTINGWLSPVPADKREQALEFLVAKDPQVKLWAKTHTFDPFWIAPENMTNVIWQGGAGEISEIQVDDYLAAPFQKDTLLATQSEVTLEEMRKPNGFHPRPHFWQGPDLARWLVHESQFAGVGVHHGHEVTAASVSISDGDGYEDSDGVIFAYLPKDGMIYHDLMNDSRASLTFSEIAIANGTAPGCNGATAESPPCVRLTITGRITPVPDDLQEKALKHLFKRHPSMTTWSNVTEFVPFWLNPDDIDEFFLIPFYGGSVHFTTEKWLAARWYRGGSRPAPVPTPAPTPSSVKMACKVCGHVFNAETDSQGVAFEDLPDDWLCPVCGAKKSAYHPITFEDMMV